MSSNQTINSSQECQNCIHKDPTLKNGTFLCKLHDEHYLKDPVDCEDWEAKNSDEHGVIECD